MFHASSAAPCLHILDWRAPHSFDNVVGIASVITPPGVMGWYTGTQVATCFSARAGANGLFIEVSNEVLGSACHN